MNWVGNNGNIDIINLPLAHDKICVVVVTAVTTGSAIVNISDSWANSKTHIGVYRTNAVGWVAHTLGY